MHKQKWPAVLLHSVAWILYFILPHLLRPEPPRPHHPSPDGNLLPPPGDLFWLYFSFLQGILLVPVFYLNALYLLPVLLRRRRYGLLVAAGVLGLGIHYGWGWAVGRLLLPPEGPFHGRFFSALTSFGLVLSLAYAYHASRESRRIERLGKEREVEAMKTELQFLRWQISPHFLFNALNNLVALARKKSDRLEPMLMHLSGLMRYMLYETDGRKVSLQQEAEYLQSFIRLQSLRHDAVVLETALRVPTDCPLFLEPMLLIPFVENAFKHGIDFIEEPVIRIVLAVEDETLHLQVANKYLPGAGHFNKDEARGIGLVNVRKRLELLEDNIRGVPFLQLAGSYRNAMEALPQLQQEPIDLVFSDIQMPGLSGTQLIASLAVRPMFILITAHEKFALEGYALDVVDYLLKPVPYDRFLKACSKALELHKLRHAGEAAPAGSREFLFVPVDYRMVKVLLAEVERVEGVKDYVRIHFNNGKRPLLVRMSMKAAQDALPEPAFLRIHKSHIVSVRSITAVRRSGLFIGEEELPVGEQYREAVQRLVEGH